MRRSEINTVLRQASAFIQGMGFHLPPFAFWSPEDWTSRGPEAWGIAANQLGWDITDFGSGAFSSSGLLLFTLRNGHPVNWETLEGKLYSEKIMVVRVDQVTPLHFHWNKTEDIINRGGGKLAIRVYPADEDDGLGTHDVAITSDGISRVVPAGDTILLEPGQSITMPTRVYHTFWATERDTLVGEVSMVNDDERDNRFYEPAARFPQIREDEPPLYLLVGDYHRYYHPSHRVGESA